MLKAFKHLSRERGSGFDDDDSGADEPSKSKKDFLGVSRLRKRFIKDPNKMTQRYIDKCLDELGVSHSSQVWQLKE